MAVKFVKLKSGDEFVASVNQDNGVFEFTHPVRLLPTEQGLGIIPLFPFCKDVTHSIDKNEVLLACDLESEIEEGYKSQIAAMEQARKQAETGLILPESAMAKPTIKLSR